MQSAPPQLQLDCSYSTQAKLRQKAGSLARGGVGSVTLYRSKSKAQHAKHAAAALFNASQAAAKSGVAGPGWGWVCNEVLRNEVCNEAKQSTDCSYSAQAKLRQKEGSHVTDPVCSSEVCSEGV